MNLPPVISSLFINGEFVGAYDNPLNLLDAIDDYLETEDKEKFSEKESMQGCKAEIFFGVVNPVVPLETFAVKNKDLKDKDSIKKLYDIIIDKLEAEFKNYIEDNEDITNKAYEQNRM